MRLVACIIAFAAIVTPVSAADLLYPIPANPVIVEVSPYCVIAAPTATVEVYEEPQGSVWGHLPVGMEVEVLDAPFTRYTDLWVRIKPPRRDHYYGWVRTASFTCH